MRAQKLLSFILLCLSPFIFTSPLLLKAQDVTPAEEEKIYFPYQNLIGVIISENPSLSIAILENKKNSKTKIMKIGDVLFGFTLTHIGKKRVILKKGGQTFQIFLGRNKLTPSPPGEQEKVQRQRSAAQKTDNALRNKNTKNILRIEFKRSELEKRIQEELSSIIKEAQLVPHYVNGEIRGFKVARLPSSGIATESGIQENDIVKEINGIELDDWSTLLDLFNRLKDKNEFRVHVEREGKIINIHYVLK